MADASDILANGAGPGAIGEQPGDENTNHLDGGSCGRKGDLLSKDEPLAPCCVMARVGGIRQAIAEEELGSDEPVVGWAGPVWDLGRHKLFGRDVID